MPVSNSVQGQISVVSLFSGAGGLDLGLAAAGMDIVYASDIDGPSCETLEFNKRVAAANGLDGLEHTVVERCDVGELSGASVLEAIGMNKGDVDVLAGGPPCQAFSVFGRRAGMDDKRGKLVFEYARLLNEIRPRVFVFENVYGLLSVQGGSVFEDVCLRLSDPGEVKYHVAWTRLNAQDYGVPQSRDRVIVVGVREDVGNDGVQFAPVAKFGEPGRQAGIDWRTVSHALKDLPSPTSTRGKKVANHRIRRHGDEVIGRYSRLKHGERDSKTRINRLDPGRPSFTIVVGSDAGGGKGHVHPEHPREVSPRESARMQSFPDWWEFRGSSVRHEIRQVGNAVPPLLGFTIGNEIRNALFGFSRVPFAEGVRLLSQEHLFSDPEFDKLADVI